MTRPGPIGTPRGSASGRVFATFEELAEANADGNGNGIDVALAAALLARDVYEDLDVVALLQRFDDLAAPLVPAGLDQMSGEAQAEYLAQHLYDHLGFAGNEADYYDPRNSLLPDVLGRRLGIPITLAVVYVEVARRLGVKADGVAFPGHFLVRIDPTITTAGRRSPLQPVIVDPFFGGRVLDEPALAQLLRKVMGPSETLRPELLAAAPPRAILVRILNNLKTVYLARGENSRALLALDRIVSLTPDSPSALRDRGLMAAQLGVVQAARADLSRFLELAPRADDAAMIRARLASLTAGNLN